MKTWQTLLRDGDPVAREPGLSPDEADRIRRRVLSDNEAAPATGRPVRTVKLIATLFVVGRSTTTTCNPFSSESL